MSLRNRLFSGPDWITTAEEVSAELAELRDLRSGNAEYGYRAFPPQPAGGRLSVNLCLGCVWPNAGLIMRCRAPALRNWPCGWRWPVVDTIKVEAGNQVMSARGVRVRSSLRKLEFLFSSRLVVSRVIVPHHDHPSQP
jgi:hypothetical protein